MAELLREGPSPRGAPSVAQNLLPKTPYKFKKSYGGTPEPQTPQDAPWLRGPSLKRKGDRVHIITFRVTTRLRSKSNRCI